MPTFVAKGQNFAGNPLNKYVPPIADLTVCAWIGDTDSVYLKNFGTLGGVLTQVGASPQQDAMFRRFSLTNYLILPTYRKTRTSVMIVFRDASQPASGADFSYLCSSERESGIDGHNYNGGRRGYSMVRGYNPSTAGTHALTVSAWGDNGSAPISAVATMTPLQDATPVCVVGILEPGTTTGARATIKRLTAAAVTAGPSANPAASTADLTDEAGYPLRVGASYRAGIFGKPFDGAFLAMGERVWGAAETDEMYQSVKLRFAAKGFAI